jgi:hypothetical protein
MAEKAQLVSEVPFLSAILFLTLSFGSENAFSCVPFRSLHYILAVVMLFLVCVLLVVSLWMM